MITKDVSFSIGFFIFVIFGVICATFGIIFYIIGGLCLFGIAGGFLLILTGTFLCWYSIIFIVIGSILLIICFIWCSPCWPCVCCTGIGIMRSRYCKDIDYWMN